MRGGEPPHFRHHASSAGDIVLWGNEERLLGVRRSVHRD